MCRGAGRAFQKQPNVYKDFYESLVLRGISSSMELEGQSTVPMGTGET
jgi:hypothetical protein